MKMLKYHSKHVGAYDCKGATGSCEQPNNRYAPEQEAWLRERKLYTGRMIADVAHLPAHLKFL